MTRLKPANATKEDQPELLARACLQKERISLCISTSPSAAHIHTVPVSSNWHAAPDRSRIVPDLQQLSSSTKM